MDRHGRDDGVDSGAVGQPGVDHRRRLVDAPAHAGDHLLDDLAELALVDEVGLGPLDLAVALDVDLIDAVAHDLGDVRVVEQGLQGTVAQEIRSNLADELCPLGRRQRHLGGPQGLVEMAGHERGELVGLHSL